MVFKYSGNYEQLTREVNEFQETINTRYREILGEQRYKRLEETVNRLLVSKSFIDSREEWKSRFRQELPENATNSMGLITLGGGATLELDKDGRLKGRKIRTSPVFYISEEGSRNSGSYELTDKPIASYIHEFNHFLTYALQKVPLYLATLILFDKVKPSNTHDFSEFVKGLISLPLGPERTERAILGLQAFSLQEFYEKANRLLDKQVLDSIGLKLELPWRGKTRQSDSYALPPDLILQYTCEGDPFRTLTDKEAIDRLLDWQGSLNPAYKLNYYLNFLDSLGQTKISRVSITELFNKNQKKKKKKRMF